jgi:hypothetical protein
LVLPDAAKQPTPRLLLPQHKLFGGIMVSKKQEIYFFILNRLLAHARNIHRKPLWKRFFCDLYPEMELVHAIPDQLKYPEIDRLDIYWIDVQARIYVKAFLNNKQKHPHGEQILHAIRELIEIVPEEIKLESGVDFSIFMT